MALLEERLLKRAGETLGNDVVEIGIVREPVPVAGLSQLELIQQIAEPELMEGSCGLGRLV